MFTRPKIDHSFGRLSHIGTRSTLQNMHYYRCLLFFGLLSAVSSVELWLSSLSKFKDAVCTDGSPAGYYIRRSVQSSTWLVYLQGGGWCYDEASCNVRCGPSFAVNADDPLCSSKSWNQTVQLVRI